MPEGTEPQRRRTVGFLLGTGIFLLPYFFAWFTLRRGHSVLSRVVSFGWLLFLGSISITAMQEVQDMQVTTQDRQVRQPPAQERVQTRAHQMRETFRLGDYEYTILSTHRTRQIGNQFTRERASEGGIFLIVTYRIKNLSNKTQTVLADDLKFVGSKGREYRASSSAQTALIMSGGKKDLFLSELQPGLSRTMKTVFESPVDALGTNAKLVIPEKGLFGAGSVEVPIQ